MKILMLTILMVFGMEVAARGITGFWKGKLELPGGNSLTATLDIQEGKEGIKVLFGSPDQMVTGMKVDVATYSDQKLKIEMKKLMLTYSGSFDPQKDTISGTFQQGSFKQQLSFKRTTKKGMVRSYKQTPKGPYPYKIEEVKFENSKAKITLAGTLTTPKDVQKNMKKPPVVILIAGSGPNDRNETPMGHFHLLADYLTRRNIAVLRFDKRGVKGSIGDYKSATTLDFADDVVSAIHFLKKRNQFGKVGLIGHSEGGLIAPIVGAKYPELVDFIILMAAPGISGQKLLPLQVGAIMKGLKRDQKLIDEKVNNMKMVCDLVATVDDTQKVKQQLLKKRPDIKEEYLKGYLNPWFKVFMRLDPADYLRKIKQPILVLNGTLDLQVPSKGNLEPIETALKTAGNKQFKVIDFKGLNHLFQRAKTGTPSEYGKLDDIIAPVVLKTIGNWIEGV